MAPTVVWMVRAGGFPGVVGVTKYPVAWQTDDFAASLTAASANTVQAYPSRRQVVRGLGGPWWSRGTRRRRSPPVAPVPGPSDDPPVCPPIPGAQGSGAAPVLPVGPHDGPDRERPDRRPRGEGRLPQIVPGADLATLLEPAVDPDEPLWRRHRDDAVLELLYGSGLRVSELCGLDLDGIDLPAGVVTVWGKGSKERRVPLSAASVDALGQWLRLQHHEVLTKPTPALFLNGRGTRLGARDVRRVIDRRSPSPTHPHAHQHVRHSSARRRGPASCKSCSDTATCPRHSATPTSARSDSAPCTPRPTPRA